MQQIFVIFISFLLVLAYGQNPEPAPIRGPEPFSAFQPKAPNPNPQPARAPQTTNPVPQPQVKVPSTNPVPQPQVKVPSPQVKVPSTNPVPQPQVKVPSTNPVPQPQVKVPSPQVKVPSTNPVPQPQVKVPSPQVKVPSTNPVPQPQVKVPSTNPVPQPQVKVPSTNPVPQPSPEPFSEFQPKAPNPTPQPGTIILVPVPQPLKEQPASPNPVPQSVDGSSDKSKGEVQKIRDNAVQIKADIDQSISAEEATTTIPTTILYLDQITVEITVTLGANGTQDTTLKNICETWRNSLTKTCGRVFNDCTWTPTSILSSKRQATGGVYLGSTVSPAPITTTPDGGSNGGSLLFSSILSTILFVGIGFLL